MSFRYAPKDKHVKSESQPPMLVTFSFRYANQELTVSSLSIEHQLSNPHFTATQYMKQPIRFLRGKMWSNLWITLTSPW